jgi:hypothetical protein
MAPASARPGGAARDVIKCHRRGPVDSTTGQVLPPTTNRVEELHDPTAHADAPALVIRAVSFSRGGEKRLPPPLCDPMPGRLEPCPMRD